MVPSIGYSGLLRQAWIDRNDHRNGVLIMSVIADNYVSSGRERADKINAGLIKLTPPGKPAYRPTAIGTRVERPRVP